MADLSITPASVLKSGTGLTSTGLAGATITQGDVLYRDATDANKLKLADADSSAATATVVGIALNAASAGQPLTYATQDDSFTPGATLTVGEVYALSDTPGGLAPVADLGSGDYTSIVLVATTASVGVLKISNSGGQTA